MIWDLRRIKIGYKNMRLWIIIPFILLYVFLMPYQNNILNSNLPLEDLRSEFFHIAQAVIPFAGIWWPFLYFRTLIEEEGMEVIYAADPRPKFRFILYFYCTYILLCLPLYIWYLHIYKSGYMEVFRLIMQNAVLCMIFYCFTYLLRSSLLAVLIVLILECALLFTVNSMWEGNLFASNIYAEDIASAVYWIWGAGLIGLSGLVMKFEKALVVYR